MIFSNLVNDFKKENIKYNCYVAKKQIKKGLYFMFFEFYFN
ncbi:hypothetical protein FLAVO9AF_220054 [Flavobacterium sp. 9AF]|nr:hypothetical protein FLAVO9AF_220054 [Flavobacterium sp. 9AF]